MTWARLGRACILAVVLVGLGPVGDASAEPGVVAVIGDYGSGSRAERQVADLVAARSPEAVLTVGDNAYAGSVPGTGNQYAGLVGAYYCRFIAAAPGSPECPAASMATVNAFFPAAGNHDYSDAGIEAYRATFAAARARTWYDVRIGEVQYFILDSQLALDDPASMARQRAWLQRGAQRSTAAWQVVLLHHPAYSSGAVHGSTARVQWPFRDWGVDLVIAGHDHLYERISRGGLTYLVNGSGGAELYGFGNPVAGSVRRDAEHHGALFLRATSRALTGEFRTAGSLLVDRFTLIQPAARPARHPEATAR